VLGSGSHGPPVLHVDSCVAPGDGCAEGNAAKQEHSLQECRARVILLSTRCGVQARMCRCALDPGSRAQLGCMPVKICGYSVLSEDKRIVNKRVTPCVYRSLSHLSVRVFAACILMFTDARRLANLSPSVLRYDPLTRSGSKNTLCSVKRLVTAMPNMWSLDVGKARHLMGGCMNVRPVSLDELLKHCKLFHRMFTYPTKFPRPCTMCPTVRRYRPLPYIVPKKN
jgi:hypothetical protein